MFLLLIFSFVANLDIEYFLDVPLFCDVDKY